MPHLRDLPARAMKRAYREAVWYLGYRWNPFHRYSMSFEMDLPGVKSALRAAGVPFEPLQIPVADFTRFLGECGYPSRYYQGSGTNYVEKCLEHFLSYKVLDIGKNDVYIDLGSDGSPFPGYLRDAVGCQVFVNDLSYPAGITDGWRIGSDAACLPLPDQSISKATLHCALEHFEGDADYRLITELGRVLKPGGKACIAPLYLHTEYVGLTDPMVDRTGQAWDPAMKPVFLKGHGQRQGRFYDVPQYVKRFRAQSATLKPTLYSVANLADVAPDLWCDWILTLEKVRH